MLKIILRKEIECILRAILYSELNIVLACKDDIEAKQCMNDSKNLIEEYKIIQPEIKEVDKNGCISLKNGSYIKIIKAKERNDDQTIRGKRFKSFLDNIQDTFLITDEEFENAIKPYVKNKVQEKNQMYVDVGLEKYNGTDYSVRIYREDIMESITSNNMKIIAEYIRNITQANNYSVYIDDRGLGRYLADCLEQIGVTYTVLKHDSFKLNVPE